MHAYLERALQTIETATNGITIDELKHHRPGKWCAAEVLEHLSRAFSSTSKLLERHLATGQPSTARATSAEQRRQLVVITLGYLPNGRPAPPFTIPQGLPPEQAIAHFGETLAAMDAAITRCEQQFGPRITIASHPIFGPLTVK